VAGLSKKAVEGKVLVGYQVVEVGLPVLHHHCTLLPRYPNVSLPHFGIGFFKIQMQADRMWRYLD